MNRFLSLGIVVTFSTLVSVAHAQTIDTTGSWNGSNFISAWGNNGLTPTYGQTFVAPVGATNLSDFLVSIQSFSGTGTNNFSANLFAWDSVNRRPTGGALFSQNSSVSLTNPTFTPVLTTVNAPVTAGTTYVFYLSTIGLTANTSARWGYLGTSPQAGTDATPGNFVFNNTTTASNLLTTTWDNPTYYNGQATHDLAFRARFSDASPSVTPELPGLALVVPALLPVALMAMRRRRSKAII